MTSKSKCIFIAIGITIIIIVAWHVTLKAKSTADKQFALIEQANTLISDGIYILAVPLLEEAAGYNSAYTLIAEEELKKAYLFLIDNRGFSRRYTNLLEKQMGRRDASPDVFAEAANYYQDLNSRQNALAALRDGIMRTQSNDLVMMYENIRYAYDINRNGYESVTSIYNNTIQVMLDGKWGIADSIGTIFIPCEYDEISTFHQNRAIVQKDNAVYAVDRNNNRIAVPPVATRNFRNFAENRVALLTNDGWQRATGAFELGSSVFEDLGMYSGGYVAAKTGGKWGVIDIGNNWFIPAEYDDVIKDELGRCYAQGAVFVRSGDVVYLYTEGERLSDTYQDARPFSDEGYAAVKNDEKWGFIDTNGNLIIKYRFDDAKSFGGHLAAVKIGQKWGYISLNGTLVIEAVFFDAKSFSNGSAPVLTQRGWQLITLIEYKRGRAL